MPKSTKKPAAKAVKKASPKSKNAAPAKKKAAVRKAAPARPATRRTVSKTTAPVTVSITVTREDIALRAYYIAERRRHLGISGDPHNDWLEAERQLLRRF